MKRPTALFVSSFGTVGISGGSLQMMRHFVSSGDFDLQEFSGEGWDPIEKWTPQVMLLQRLVRRLSRTRIQPLLMLLSLTTRHGNGMENLLQFIKSRPQPDFVATIAFGRYQFLALRAAKRLGIPLVSFFHDWWPDLVFPCGSPANRVLQKAFFAHYRSSDLPLCVSSEMRDQLPFNPRSQVLLPIGQNIAAHQPKPAIEHSKPIKIVYLGSLQADTGECLRILSSFLLKYPVPGISLECYGSNPSWPPEEIDALRAAGLYSEADNGTEPPEKLMGRADLILVPTSFSPLMRRRVATSFPSKLLDALPFSTPILCWGPSYSCANAFVQKNQLGCVVTTPSPSELASSAMTFARSDAYQTSSLACLNCFRGTGSPETIHKHFCDLLQRTLRLQSRLASSGDQIAKSPSL